MLCRNCLVFGTFRIRLLGVSERSEKSRVARRVTLKSVADASGLGLTTVSDILNGGETIRARYNQQTRDRVLSITRKLGYSVDRAAQQLRRGKSGVVGLLLTRHMHDVFFARIVDLAEQEFRKRDFQMQLAIAQENEVPERLAQLQQARVEGLIFGPAYDAKDVAPLDDLNMPTIIFGGHAAAKHDVVALDHVAARKLVAEHLKSQGHRVVGFLEMHHPRSAKVRSDASILRAAELSGEAWWMADSQSQEEQTVYEAALRFAERWKAADKSVRPTALICHDDHTAAIALSALWEKGIRVPDDLSVAGCNNMPSTRFLVPPLTTVDLHVEEQIQLAVDRLVFRINHPRAERLVQRVKANLVERASVAKVSASS